MTTRSACWVAAGALAIAGCQAPEPSNTIRVSGHIEATEVQLAPDVGGRLLELRPAEGDRVAAGDIVARLDTRDVELQIARARADRAAAELKAADADLVRFEALLAANAGSQKQRDDAQARVDVARERVRALQQRIEAAREGVARLEAGASREEIDGARARVAAADAQLAVLEKGRADATVVSPVAGLVTQKLAEAGEVVAPRTPLLVVTDLDNAWANLFVPEPLIPRIALGQAATILTDAGGRVPGTVTFISPQAEFTPRNVQTAEERSKLVYRIKVSVDNRAGTLKVGMPVDAELTLP